MLLHDAEILFYQVVSLPARKKGNGGNKKVR